MGPSYRAAETEMKTFRWVIASLILVTLGGCASEALPPRLTQEQADAIARAHFKATVGVKRYNTPVYSDNLVEYLRSTGLFDRVDYLEAFGTPPTFTARVDAAVYGTATIPILTFVSLGAIPTNVDEDHGAVFSLLPNADPKKRIPIDFRYRGRSTLGWWALIDGAFRDRTWGSADGTRRFSQSLAWQIVMHEKEISAYANK
jgi:hypothetical protein